MKSIKDLREQYDLITEKDESEMNKLSSLVRAGLFDAKKLSSLKRALDKPADKMTAQEKRMLINLLDALMTEVLNNKSVYQKVKQDVMKESKNLETDKLTKTDIPSVLLLKRKAIRAFPNGQKVGLYYAQAIDKYVTVPFGEIGMQNIQERNLSGNVSGAILGLADYTNNSKDDEEKTKKELKPLESGKTKLTVSGPKEDDEERRRPSAQASRAERLSRLANQAMVNNIRESAKESIVLGGNLFELNNKEAKKVLSLYESLNKTNKRKMLGMMLESEEGLDKVISFAVRQ